MINLYKSSKTESNEIWEKVTKNGSNESNEIWEINALQNVVLGSYSPTSLLNLIIP